jgi:hypothetical protein
MLFVLTTTLPTVAQADPFGSGANAFTIDFVTIGNSGSADDAGDGDSDRSGILRLGVVAPRSLKISRNALTSGSRNSALKAPAVLKQHR